MNTKIQVLNSVDLENISGGMYKPLESCGVSSGSCGVSSGSCGVSSRNSENLKGFSGFSGFLNGLAKPFGIDYKGNFDFDFCKNSSTSECAGSLTAFATVSAVITGAVFGTYKGIKWAVKKIF